MYSFPVPGNDHDYASNDEPGCSSSWTLGMEPLRKRCTGIDGIGTPDNSNNLEDFIFREESQSSAILSQLDFFRTENTLCDVELTVENRSILAHRCVLAAGIPYFRLMFTGSMKETKMQNITINDIPYSSLRLLIDFVYTNTIRINNENVQNLLFAASILQMDSVCSACQHFLSRFLTTSNCLSIRLFAERHNCVALLSSTNDFAIDHFSDVRVQNDFRHIPFEHLCELFKRDDLQINSEEEIFETLVAWIDVEPHDRMKHLVELLALVRLSQMSLRYLYDVVKRNHYIKENRECLDMVAEAVFEMLAPMKESTLSIETKVMECSEYSASPSYSAARPMSPERMILCTKPRKSMAGVIFCAGGRGTLGDPFRSVEAFDWRKNRWIAINEMSQQRRHVGVVSAHGKIYAIGGHDGQNHLSSAEMYDPQIGSWRTIASMSTRRRGIAVAALDDAVYAVGGLDDQTCFNTVERYDIELDVWTEVARMCVQRGGVGVAALGKYLFAVGGNDGTRSLDSCERYDPLLNKWKLVKPMANRRAGAGVAVLYGYLYAVGGFDDNAPLSTCERYNIFTDTWEKLDNMISPRGGVGVASMGGLLYAIGGHDGSRYLNTVECFDPSTNQWSMVADIKECRAGAGVAWANTRIDILLKSLQESGCAPTNGTPCI